MKFSLGPLLLLGANAYFNRPVVSEPLAVGQSSVKIKKKRGLMGSSSDFPQIEDSQKKTRPSSKGFTSTSVSGSGGYAVGSSSDIFGMGGGSGSSGYFGSGSGSGGSGGESGGSGSVKIHRLKEAEESPSNQPGKMDLALNNSNYLGGFGGRPLGSFGNAAVPSNAAAASSGKNAQEKTSDLLPMGALSSQKEEKAAKAQTLSQGPKSDILVPPLLTPTISFQANDSKPLDLASLLDSSIPKKEEPVAKVSKSQPSMPDLAQPQASSPQISAPSGGGKSNKQQPQMPMMLPPPSRRAAAEIASEELAMELNRLNEEISDRTRELNDNPLIPADVRAKKEAELQKLVKQRKVVAQALLGNNAAAAALSSEPTIRGPGVDASPNFINQVANQI